MTSEVAITEVNGFEYSAVEKISPALGQGGTTVTIEGSGLLGQAQAATKVTLDGVAGTIISQSKTKIVVAAGAVDIGADRAGIAVITLQDGQTIQSIALPDDSLRKEFQYKVAGKITSVAPATGQLKTKVVIKGTNLFGYGASVASVTLAGIKAAVTKSSNTEIEVTAGTRAAKTAAGDVIVTSNTGAIVSLAKAFAYVDAGKITKVVPVQGQVGTVVTLTGTDMMAGGASLTSATFVGTAVQKISSASATAVVVILKARASAGKGDIVLGSANGASTTLTGGFTYAAPATFKPVAPANGQSGTKITIVGTALRSGGTKVAKVTLKGVEVAAISSEADDKVIVVAGKTTSAGKGDVVLISETGGIATGKDLFTALTEGAIASVTPNKGQATTVVVIKGSNLLGGGNTVAVTLAGFTVTKVNSKSGTEISVVAKTGTAKTGDVVITANTGAVITKTNGWTQLTDGKITKVTPAKGHTGTTVVIEGERLLAGASDLTKVTLAGVVATYKAGSGTDTKVTVVSNKGKNAGTAGDVVLEANTGATLTLTTGFTHVAEGAIAKVVPNTGQAGTLVEIVGTNMLGGGTKIVSVKLVGVEVATISSSTDTSVKIVVKTKASAGKGDVVLVADTGAIVQAKDAFTYVDAQKITKIDPAKGQLGTVVTITGSNMLGGGTKVKSVTLGGKAAAKVNSFSATKIIVTIADESAAKGLVVITSDTGAAVSSTASSWEYLEKGKIDKVDPATGQNQSPVTITGARLLGGGTKIASLTLAGLKAEVKTTATNKITIIAAASAKKVTGDVIITSDTGSIVTLTNGFAYLTPGGITKVAPAKGQKGTAVVITGTSDPFFGDSSKATKVTLAGVSATITSQKANEVKVTAASATKAETGDVVITSASGIVVSKANAWQNLLDGKIVSVEPAKGVIGAIVNIYGSSLRGQGSKVASVTLSGKAASIKRETDFYVQVAAGASDASAAGDVVVTADTGATITQSKAWTYVKAGDITKVVPAQGAAGAKITITGTDMRQGSKNVASVTLAGFTATVSSESEISIVVVAGLHSLSAGKKGDVVVTTVDGSTTTETNGFTYVILSDIHSVSPSKGHFDTIVTITGVELFGGSAKVKGVTLAGVAVVKIVSQKNTEVVVIAQKNANAKTGDVVITTDNDAKVELTNGWSYVEAATVTSITPAKGQVGTVVVIAGKNMLMGATTLKSVKVAGIEALKIVSATETAVTVILGALAQPAAGTVKLTAATGATVETAQKIFTYVEASKITKIVPAKGQFKTRVTITGTILMGGGAKVALVTVADSAATIVSDPAKDDVIIADLGSAAAGIGDVIVQSNTGALATLADGFTYVAVPKITSVTPSSGQTNTKVTVVGTGMLGGGTKFTGFTFAGITAKLTSGDDTKVIVTIQKGSAGTGTVVLTTDTGSQVTSAANAYTQLSDGSVTKVDPALGVSGSRVTITGTNLLMGSKLKTVTLDAKAATVTSSSDTKVVVIAGDSDKGNAAAVILTAESGATTTKDTAWTYAQPGTVAKLTPAQGQVGTKIVISGASLFAGGSKVVAVTLNAVAVASISDTQSATKIEVVAAAATKSDGAKDVVMTTDIGTSITGKAKWTYLEPGAIAKLEPTEGRVGTKVTITGARLRGGGSKVAAVQLGNHWCRKHLVGGR